MQNTSPLVTVNLYGSQLHYNCFHNKTQKHSRDSHIICGAAVSKPLHLAKTCSKESQTRRACEGTQKEAEEWVVSQSQAKMCCSLGLTFKAGMLSNSQKGQKERKGRGREEREEGICASLWETLLVLIYTSMTTAQNELTVRGEQQQPKARKLKKRKKAYGEHD